MHRTCEEYVSNSIPYIIKRMYTAFCKGYVKEILCADGRVDTSYKELFPEPFVLIVRYPESYTYKKKKEGAIILGECLHSYDGKSESTIIFNLWYQKCIACRASTMANLIHEFAHYIVYTYLGVIMSEEYREDDKDGWWERVCSHYNDDYFGWDDLLRNEYNSFISKFYLDHHDLIGASLTVFKHNIEMCSHLSFEFYKACYLAWRVYAKELAEDDYPLFLFEDILGYKGVTQELIPKIKKDTEHKEVVE